MKHKRLLRGVGVALLLLCGAYALSLIYFQWYISGSAPVVTAQYNAETLWANPLPTPKVISELPSECDENCRNYKWLTVTINAGELWELASKDVVEAVEETVGVTVDGQPIPRYSIGIGKFGGVAHFDEQGEVIAYHYSGINVSFGIPDLTEGLHVATIRFESNAGTIYTHEWAFQVMR